MVVKEMFDNDIFEQQQDQASNSDSMFEPSQPQPQPQSQAESASPFDDSTILDDDVVAIEPIRATPPQQRRTARQNVAPQPAVKPEEIIARSNFSQGYSRGAKTAISPYRSEGASLSEINNVPARPPLQNQKTTAKNADPIWGSPEDPIIVAAQRAFALGRHEAALNLYDGVLSRDPSNTKAIEGKVEVLNAMGLARSEMDIVPNAARPVQNHTMMDTAMLETMTRHQNVDFVEARRISPNSRLGLNQRSGRVSVDPDSVPVQPMQARPRSTAVTSSPEVDFVPNPQNVYSSGVDFMPATQGFNQGQALTPSGDPNVPAVPVNNVQASAIPPQTQNQNALSLGLNSSSLASPDRAAALSAQAMNLMQSGQFEAALPMLEQAFSMDRQNAALAYNLAVAADQSGMESKAVQYYEQAIALNRMTGGRSGIDTAAIYARLSALASR
jgi:tetratricopeptide (TPR) repeat protein